MYAVYMLFAIKRNIVFTLNIGTPYLLTILVLKFEIVHATISLVCLKYCCMYGKQFRP